MSLAMSAGGPKGGENRADELNAFGERLRPGVLFDLRFRR